MQLRLPDTAHSGQDCVKSASGALSAGATRLHINSNGCHSPSPAPARSPSCTRAAEKRICNAPLCRLTAAISESSNSKFMRPSIALWHLGNSGRSRRRAYCRHPIHRHERGAQ
jgi:hypothetical protein